MTLRSAAPLLSWCLLLAASASCHRTGALENKPEIVGLGNPNAEVRTRTRPTMVELDKACTSGDGFSCFELAQKYAKGDGLPKDEQRAANYYYRGCFSDTNSCVALGLMHLEGRGVAQSDGDAVTWFRSACSRGNPNGCSNLAVMYQKGAGVAPDPVLAATLLMKSCDGNDAFGCFHLGMAYSDGRGVEKDESHAAELFHKACESGEAAACTNLGIIYLGGKVRKDEKIAAALFKRACDANELKGCVNLGQLSLEGRGTPKDSNLGLTLLRRGCQDGGELSGCSKLGTLYLEGRVVAKDVATAAALFQKACDGGQLSGCYWLGVIHETGQGVPRDDATAAAFYRRASDAGVVQATSALGTLFAKIGKPDEALKYLTQACDANEPAGCNQLGLALRERADEGRASIAFRKACSQGIGASCYNLALQIEQVGESVGAPSEAARFHQIACQKEIYEACTHLGLLYQKAAEYPRMRLRR